jgi:TP901 family phage tail tape measure protein
MSDYLKISMKILADASQAVAELGKLKSPILNVGGNLSQMFGQQALDSLKKYTFEAAKLNKELTRISQVTGTQTTGGVGIMNKAIFEAAKKTGIEYEDILSGYGKLASAGIGLDEIKNSMENITKAAVVSKATTEQLGNAVLVASKSFNLDMKTDSAVMLDKMYKAGKLGNAELDKLSTILGRVGPMAKLAGLGLEETLAFIEGMASSMEGEEVVATMSKSVMRMFNDPKTRKAVEKATGAQFFNADGGRNNVFDIFGAIQDKYLSFDNDQGGSRFFEKTFEGVGQREKEGLLSILNDQGSVDKMRDMFERIRDASGEINKDMSDLMKNVYAQTNRIKATWREIATLSGKTADGFLAPIMQKGVDAAQEKIDPKIASYALTGGMAILGGMAIASQIKIFKDLLTKGTLKDAALGKVGNAASGVLEGEMWRKMGVTPVFIAGAASGVFSGGAGLGGAGNASGGLLDRFGNPVIIPPGATKGSGKFLGQAGKFAKGALAFGKNAAMLTPTLLSKGLTPLGGALAGTGAAGAASVAGLGVAAAGVGVAIGSLFNVVSDEIAKRLTGKTLTDQISDGLAAMLSEGFRKNAKGEFGMSGEEALENLKNKREKERAAIQNKIDVYIDIDKDGRLIDTRKFEKKEYAAFGEMLSDRYAAFSGI